MTNTTNTQNLSTTERALSAGLGGLALMRYSRKSALGTVLAAGLLQRAATGHCAVYQALGVNTQPASTPTLEPASVKLTKSVTIQAEPTEIYPFFTSNLERLVELSPEVLALERVSDTESRWTVSTPIGDTTFLSRVISEEKPHHVSWMCEEGHIPHSGEVLISPGSRGTLVCVTLEYRPPGGKLAATLARVTGKEPHEALERTLYNLRALVETGEIPTASPQPVGAGKDTNS